MTSRSKGSDKLPGQPLERFAKVFLAPGESRVLSFTLGRDDLEFVNLENKSVAEPGDFTILAGGLSVTFTLK